MREDMFKIIVERPRRGRSWASKSKLRYDKCEDRHCVSGKRLVREHSGNVKYLNENLAPLKRYLGKQVGRKWDDVFSDICKHLDTGSTVKMHVREHIDDFVKRDVYYDIDGKLTGVAGWRGGGTPSTWWTELYVDPADGTLKRTRDLCHRLGVTTVREVNKKRRKKKPNPNLKRLSDDRYYVKLDGHWYHIKTQGPLNTSFGYPLTPDGFYEELVKDTWQNHMRWQVVSKKQLNKKTMLKHGLVNDLVEQGGAYG